MKLKKNTEMNIEKRMKMKTEQNRTELNWKRKSERKRKFKKEETQIEKTIKVKKT
jgi:hypothetical protein